MAAPAENWDAEATQNPENNFSLYATTSQSVQRPKTAFLRYVRIVHGTDVAIRVREQLASQHITDKNFQQFKESSFATEYKRRYEPSPPLGRRKF